MKQCTKCKKILPLDLYYKDRTTKDWYKFRCKECSEKYKNKYIYKEWVKNNRDRVKISVDKYNNKPSRKEYMKSYHNKHYNKENRAEYWKIYKKNNYERIAIKNYKYSKTINWKERHRINQIKRRKLARLTDDWTININSITILLQKQNNKCNICWCKLSLSYWITRIIDWKHIDHIVPLSKWWRHSIDNIQWLCYKCNLSKSNKLL